MISDTLITLLYNKLARMMEFIELVIQNRRYVSGDKRQIKETVFFYQTNKKQTENGYSIYLNFFGKKKKKRKRR